ncbi:MAG: IclR family transcriptional regulator [Actinomycetota bacterium]|nr:IclR family transcriptional regulator [Actinomycetota bacterium]
MAAVSSDRVQSVARAFSLLEHLADAGGALGVTEMATVSGLPPPTIHRLLRSLVSQGYVRQDSSRRYAIGPRLIRIGEAASRMLGAWATPFLTELVQRVGETANMALLDGDGAVYVAQVPSRNTVRMFTEVGRVVQLHGTGVGKALLGMLSDDEIRAIVARTGLPAVTEHTITSLSELLASVERGRRIGYTIDDGEQELGVRCVAVPIPGLPFKAALSVSGPSSRVSVGQTSVIAPVLQEVAVQMREGFPSGV